MAGAIATQTPTFDVYSHDFHRDPFPTYRAMRDFAPVYYSSTNEHWALSKYADVRRAARDWEVFSSADGVGVACSSGTHLGLDGSFLESDPPRHTALRRLAQEFFSPKALSELEQEVAHSADALAFAMAEGGGDVVSEFAAPLTVQTVLTILGLPASDWQHLYQLMVTSGHRGDGDPRPSSDAEHAMEGLARYFSEVVGSGDARRTQGLASAVVEAHAADKGFLGHQDAVSFLYLVLDAGSLTSANLISGMFLAFAEAPHVLDGIQQGRLPYTSAVEELLRYLSPIQALSRRTRKAITLEDQEIPANSRVLLLFGSANRDERQFPNPDRLAVDHGGKPPRHIAFGNGIHACVGAALARLEAKAALAALVRHLSHYEILAEPEWLHIPAGRGPARLEIRTLSK